MRVVETVSTIQPIAQALKQQQLQHQHTPAAKHPSGVHSGSPQQTPQGMKVAYQQPQPRYQRPPPIPGISTSPQKTPGNMCATSTWTPSTNQSSPCSSAPSSPPARPPPHIPNLSPT